MVLVIGLDGGTMALARPWMEQGKLPVLARLCASGESGTLRSTVPAATLPSWTTFMTGVNPGRHGIFDFTQRRFDTYGIRFVNSSFRKVPSIWRLLSEAGRRVAVLGMPGTYPPEPVNGCMISGFDAPVTTRANRSFIYPPSLADEIMRLGGFSFADFQEFHTGPRWYRAALTRLLQGVEAKARLAEALMVKEPWDCLALVFGETDTVAHHFWHFHDRASPRHDGAGAIQHGDAIELVYRAVDAAIGRLLDSAPDSGAVLVASDHGFGGVGSKAVHLNRWLAHHGWLQFTGGSNGALAHQLKRVALRMVPDAWQAPIFRSFNGRLANRLESRARFAAIDWHRTVAFSEELNYFPSVWINRIGRDPRGVVSDADYDRSRTEVAEALQQWRDPETGSRVVRAVWRREHLYDGPWVDRAPDLVLELAEDCGYAYTCLPSRGGRGPALRRLAPAQLVGGKRFGMSGSHRADGLFILSGAAWGEARSVAEARMIDMAPTILSLCGVPVPAWMEGTTLTPGAGRVPLGADHAAGSLEAGYTAAEEHLIEDRLRALGYLA